MPRPAKGPRLYLKRTAAGAIWIIRDGGKRVATSCAQSDVERARLALADYIARSYAPARREGRLSEIPVADVLMIYARDKIAWHPDVKRIAKRLGRLGDWWGARTLDDVTGASCRAYMAARGNTGGARRDLQDLSAAIGHHHREGLHRENVRVWLPSRGEPRDRWLTRSELARLVLTCWRMRERQEGETTGKLTMRHVARFVLMTYYTASRPGPVYAASWHAAAGRSYLDLGNGLFYRLAAGARATNKRQPPVRLPLRLLAHLRRWQALGGSYAVEYHGAPVASVKVAFGRACAAAGLGDGVSPYTLRHTAITHMMQRRVPIWEAAGFAGTSEAMIRAHYGHHHPDHMSEAVSAIGGARGQKRGRNDGTDRDSKRSERT